MLLLPTSCLVSQVPRVSLVLAVVMLLAEHMEAALLKHAPSSFFLRLQDAKHKRRGIAFVGGCIIENLAS